MSAKTLMQLHVETVRLLRGRNKGGECVGISVENYPGIRPKELWNVRTISHILTAAKYSIRYLVANMGAN